MSFVHANPNVPVDSLNVKASSEDSFSVPVKTFQKLEAEGKGEISCLLVGEFARSVVKSNLAIIESASYCEPRSHVIPDKGARTRPDEFEAGVRIQVPKVVGCSKP